MTELLKQGQYQPLPVEKQVLIIYAGINGHVDKLPVTAVKQYEKELFAHVEDKHPKVLEEIRVKKEIGGALKDEIDSLLKAFGEKFVPSAKA